MNREIKMNKNKTIYLGYEPHILFSYFLMGGFLGMVFVTAFMLEPPADTKTFMMTIIASIFCLVLLAYIGAYNQNNKTRFENRKKLIKFLVDEELEERKLNNEKK